jgi:hypothetical protein
MNTLLMLNISPELEEELIDYLLELDSVKNFTSYHVRSHGRFDKLTLAEQVSGRRKRCQIEILLEASEVTPLLTGLAANVGRDIVYWEQSVRNAGRID